MPPEKLNEISILTIGSEILDGRVQDTNAAYISGQLNTLGFTVSNFLSCDDDISEIKKSLEFLLSKTTILIVSGGLGPTTDDLTRESISEFFSKKLIQDEKSLEHIKQIFTKRGRKFEATNAKQALFPEGAEIIPNKIGTAPGFYLTETISLYGNKREVCVFSVPGVPAELKPMLNETIIPVIADKTKSSTTLLQTAMRIFGLPESVIGGRVEKCGIAENIKVSYRAKFPEIQVVLKTYGTQPELNIALDKAANAIGREYIFSYDINTSLEMAVHQLLLDKKMTVSVAESCSGGMLAAKLTDIAGSSAYLKGGAVTYSNEAKSDILTIDPEIIKREGAVSFEVAKQMAQGCLARFKTDLAVSITGVAGPDGGSETKPVGTFYVGFASVDRQESHRYFYPSSRYNIRQYSTALALDSIRRFLSNIPFYPDYDPDVRS